MFINDTYTGYFIHPVCSVTYEISNLPIGILLFIPTPQFIKHFILFNHEITCLQEIRRILDILESNRTGIRDIGLTSFSSFGGNQNYPARSIRTVNGSSRSVLQNINCLDIIRIEINQGVVFFTATICRSCCHCFC